jgi:hypothetical protein
VNLDLRHFRVPEEREVPEALVLDHATTSTITPDSNAAVAQQPALPGTRLTIRPQSMADLGHVHHPGAVAQVYRDPSALAL